jgi:L-amino acid N-acyltransferase YncA
VHIAPLLPEHADAVLRIYQAGIDGGDATFETAVPTWSDFDSARLPEHRFVALEDGLVVGWIVASPTSSRCVYAGVVEVSVYVAPSAQGRGVGRRLLEHFVASTEAAGIWTLQAGVFRENVASLQLHAALGFREVGVHERLGQAADGRWRDVVLLERRSSVVG